MKKLQNYNQLNQVFVVMSVLLGLWAFTRLPETVASHWDSNGEVNGYFSRFWGAYLMPLLIVFVYILYVLIPKIEIHKKNLSSFKNNYDRFFSSLLVFMNYIYIMTLWWNIQGEFNFNRILSIGFAFLIWESSVLISQAKRNWFVGIRTPWTLSNDRVWKDTHRLGSKMFKMAAIFALFGAIFPTLAIEFLIIPLITAALLPIIYSYFRYKEIKSK